MHRRYTWHSTGTTGGVCRHIECSTATINHVHIRVEVPLSASAVPRVTSAGGLRILIIGALAALASCAPLGSAVYQSFVNRPQLEVPLSAAGSAEHVALELTPGRSARLVFELDVNTPSAQEQHDGDTEYQARYRFPISYRVSAADGTVIYQEQANIDWLGTRSTTDGGKRQQSLSESNPAVDAGGGTLSVRAGFRGFEVPDDGAITLSAELGPDHDYAAVAEQARLKVEHDIVDPMFSITLGVFMLVGGWVTSIVGLVGFLSAQSAAQASEDGAADSTVEARRLAVFCHLAGFAGFIIPFGGVIGPLAMWIANRESHPFVDQQGREALNFQLSLLVYMLLSFALVLILIGLLMIPLLFVFQICMMVIAAVRVSDGQDFRYPLTLRFIR